MLCKDLSPRPQLEILREPNAYPMPADMHSQTHVDKGTTGSAYAHRTQGRSTARLQHTPFSSSLQPPLPLPAHTPHTQPPLFASLLLFDPVQSSPTSHCWTEMAHQRPQAPRCRHFHRPLYGRLTQTLSVTPPGFPPSS